jgi:CRISPR-associated exonuclease Cas4
MTTYPEPDLLLLSGIQHFAFCERQWALIHIERQWAESQRTVEGKNLHERVHDPALVDVAEDSVAARSLPIVSWRLGLYGVSDLVEFRRVGGADGGIALPKREGRWLPKPVEYKRGKPKSDDRDEVQLCAQAICLEEMLGAGIAGGSLYYGQTRHRHDVAFDQRLRGRVEELCTRMHGMFEAGYTPPAQKGKHCSLCSLADVCLPDLARHKQSVKSYVERCLLDENQERV